MLISTFAGPIKVKRALNLIYNYHKFQSEKSVSVLYSIDELMTYLQQCKEDSNTDVRIYLGQYGDNNRYKDDEDRKYKISHRTVVFVPVKAGKDNVDEDKRPIADPFDEGEICPPKTGCEDDNLLYQRTRSTDLAVYNPNEPDK